MTSNTASPANATSSTPERCSSSSHDSLGGTHSRREFIRRSSLLAGAGVAAPFALDLAGLTSASAHAAGSDSGSGIDEYRALVCVFMYGGNDHWNTMIPNDAASYASYKSARSDLARPRSSILTLDPTHGWAEGRSFGFAPEWAGMKRLFDQEKLAVVANVGTLTEPVDKAAARDRARRPKALFSHNDQQSIWQSQGPEGTTTGWGGRMADIMLDDNGDNAAFTCISAGGDAVLLSGRHASQFHVSPTGVVALDPTARSPIMAEGLEAMMRRVDADSYVSEAYSQLTSRALDTSDRLTELVRRSGGVNTWFPNSGIGKQLETVAEMIKVGRDHLGLKRQVFFVATGGFDTHSNLTRKHPGLIGDIDQALVAFEKSTNELGIGDQVTTFTASDFGRALTSNGDGTDHGWGSHHVVMGGAVAGRRVVGTQPVVAHDGPHDLGQGRTIPTIAVDQYAASLASWMGAEGADIESVVPNIGRFETADLGIMR
ncbi:MAG: DUF1501 domain-containing protein [Ilumatobacter sp.]